MPNRLAGETSPYLLQHQDNPIDWWPWCPEALLRARIEDKPIFLSVGYSSCHWCHVMAHESFEDPEVAFALNSSFISIKVDREERPDIDEVYMAAVQIASGRGGWPMTVFLTPDQLPFFAGTYFPKMTRSLGSGQSFPGFLQIVSGLATAWREQRRQVADSAAEFAAGVRQVLDRPPAAPAGKAPLALADDAIEALHPTFDYEEGGFGGEPKFPPHSALAFLLDYAGLRAAAGEPDQRIEELMDQAATMSLLTLQKVALGGIHDHVGGGFHRYTVDGYWRLPHFEKMLSDNGLLLSSFARAAQAAEDPTLRSIFEGARDGIISWLEAEMTSPEGIFFSALDADSEGPDGHAHEGAFYTWTAAELRETLGGRAEDFIAAFQVMEEGNFADEATGEQNGQNVLHRISADGFAAERAILRQRRQARPRPGLDDKALCGWNGLMISGLAAAGRLDLASRAARRWLEAFEDGLPPRQIAKGMAKGTPFLDDAAYFLEALVDLAEADPDGGWSEPAAALAARMMEAFGDDGRGGLFFTPAGSERLLGRTKPAFDAAAPSPNGVAARALLRLGLLEPADRILGGLLGWAERMPEACETLLHAGFLRSLAAAIPDAGPAEAPPTALPDASAIRVLMTPREITADAEGWGRALVTIVLPEGLHINTNSPPARWLAPTTLKVEGVLGEAGFPEGENDRYEGEVHIPVRLRAKPGASEFGLTISLQPCTDTECLPVREFSLDGVLFVPELDGAG
jgi:uncharacterized protein YyaL (SSP411 family)